MNAKRLAFETLYDQGKVRVLFLLDVAGVEVPEVARAKSNGRALALDYSKRFAMPHFEVDDTGVRAVLTFGGRSHMTFVPWAAVVAVAQNGKLMEAWPPEGVVPSKAAEIEFEIAEDDVKWLSQTVAEG